MTADQRIQDILTELKTTTNTESALIRKDGRLVFSNFKMDFHSNEIFGAMSTTMLGAAKNITAECRRGYPEKVIIDTGDAQIMILNTDAPIFLMCMTNGNGDRTEIFHEIDLAAKRINELIE